MGSNRVFARYTSHIRRLCHSNKQAIIYISANWYKFTDHPKTVQEATRRSLKIIADILNEKQYTSIK